MLPVFFTSFSFFTLTSSLMPEELPIREELSIEQKTGFNTKQETNTYPALSVSNYSKPEKSWIGLIKENTSAILFAVWAVGAFGLILLFIFRNIWGHSLTKGFEPVKDKKINAFIDECRKLVKVNRKFTLHETELTGSPVLLGVFKPKLLVPGNLFNKLKVQEVRYVILHELMHLKKNDILINWLFGIVCAFQWFNPFIWYAFARMKSDREEARDADVLALLNRNESKEYGGLILKLSTICGSGANFVESVGIMEKNQKIKRRIIMIKNFRIMSFWNTLLAVVIIAGVGISCLSEAKLKETLKKEKNATEKATNKSSDKVEAAYIEEGRGWKGFRVGATRKELVAFMGKPDNPGETRYLKWKLKNMNCLIDDARGAFELRFNRGCQQILKNGIRIGTSMKEVESQYGKPTSTENRGKAKKFIYSQKGILFWFYNNNVRQIVVFRPRAFLSKDENVVRLIKQLKDKDNRVRTEAAFALGRLRDERAVEPLIKTLKDKDNRVRAEAVRSLGYLRDKRAVEPVIKALEDKDTYIRESAASALRLLRDKRAFEPLVKALQDTDSNVRSNAAWALGYLQDKRALVPLVKTLKCKDTIVRRHAAFALGLLGDKRAIEPLFRLLKDNEPSVRGCAARSLAQLGDKRAFKLVVELLKDINRNARIRTVEALELLRDKRAVEPLEKLLKTEQDSRVRKEIEKALKKLNKTPILEKYAVSATIIWLKLIDNGKYKESWNEAAEYFKAAVSKKRWEQAIKSVRKPLGKNLSRKLISKKYYTSLPGAPDGKYIVIRFKSSFKNKKSAIETITPMLEKDGKWRVSGYFIK